MVDLDEIAQAHAYHKVAPVSEGIFLMIRDRSTWSYAFANLSEASQRVFAAELYEYFTGD